MNPEFLMVKDLHQVRATIQLQKLEAVQIANHKVEECISAVSRNIEHCPELVAKSNAEVLLAAKELARAAKEVLMKVKDLNDDYQ